MFRRRVTHVEELTIHRLYYYNSSQELQGLNIDL
jgi:hypothetical protein